MAFDNCVTASPTRGLIRERRSIALADNELCPRNAGLGDIGREIGARRLTPSLQVEDLDEAPARHDATVPDHLQDLRHAPTRRPGFRHRRGVRQSADPRHHRRQHRRGAAAASPSGAASTERPQLRASRCRVVATQKPPRRRCRQLPRHRATSAKFDPLRAP